MLALIISSQPLGKRKGIKKAKHLLKENALKFAQTTSFQNLLA
jgi:hypothetical protein